MQNPHFDTPHIDRQKTAVKHIVHDYAQLISAGTQTAEPQVYPTNHHIQHAFLVHCRKFGDFYANRYEGTDFVAHKFLAKRCKIDLPTWKTWGDAMDKQLMHFSWKRVDDPKDWDGFGVNDLLLREFRQAWELFIVGLDDRLKAEFDMEIARFKAMPEFSRFF